MTYELFIGDKSFSSWSLRGWLLFEKFGIPFEEKMIGLYSGTMAKEMAALTPARLVPTVRTPEGWIIGESSALVETLAERHPEAGLLPKDPEARIYARWLIAEMHAGFTALRSACAMQLLHQYENFPVADDVKKDLARIEQLFDIAFDRWGNGSDWLFGAYSAVDAFYAPVAARIAGYDLPVSEKMQAYVEAHLNDPAFKKWRAEGLRVTYDPVPYALDLPVKPWPNAT